MATPGQLQMYNKLEVMEMFSLDHRAMCKKTGKIKRIHIIPDEKVPDACLFVIWLEDHTLGNLLRMELLRNDNVLFAGYKVPHPLDHMIELRVQTLPKSSPEIALRRAVKNLRTEVSSMLSQFDSGCSQWMEQQAAAVRVDEDRGDDDDDEDVVMDAGRSMPSRFSPPIRPDFEEPGERRPDGEQQLQDHINILQGFAERAGEGSPVL